MPLSQFATARRHWAWLCGAIERHCQFSGRPVYTGIKKNEGSCTPSLGYYTQPTRESVLFIGTQFSILYTGKSHTQVDACVCGGERQSLPLLPRLPAICSPSCIMLA